LEEGERRVGGGLEGRAGFREGGRLEGAWEERRRPARAATVRDQSVRMQEQVAESQESENLGPQPVCRLAKADPSAVLWLHTNLVWAGFSRSSHRLWNAIVAGSARPSSRARLLHPPSSFRVGLAQRSWFPSSSCLYYWLQ
jgi:hypothetical protein